MDKKIWLGIEGWWCGDADYPPNPINPWLTTHGGRATWPPQNHTAMGCTGVILNTARMAYKATMMHRCQFVEDMLVIANKPFVDCSFVYL